MIDVSEKIAEHRREVKRKSMTVKELSEEWGIGLSKAYELVNCEGFPRLLNGPRIIIIRSKVDEWVENNIGLIF